MLNHGCRVLLDAYGRRHEAQKIYLRQAASQRWIENRDQVLNGARPSSKNQSQLNLCDQQLRIVCSQCSSNPKLFSSIFLGASQRLMAPLVMTSG